jgi:uncharacterized protein YaiL (DUF2058 family)
VRTLPSAAAVTVELDVTVAAATLAEEVLEAAFLGMGEEATRPRREKKRMVDEKRMFATGLISKKVKDRYKYKQ